MEQSNRFSVALFTSAVLALGCGGGTPASSDAATADTGPAAVDAGPGADATLAECATTPSYEELRDTIFAPRCATGRCHGGTTGDGPARGPSDFTATSTRDALVGRASVHAMGLVLVRPGDLDGSFLLAKLTNDLPSDPRLRGVAMPPAEPWTMLPESELEAIRCWIAGGAP